MGFTDSTVAGGELPGAGSMRAATSAARSVLVSGGMSLRSHHAPPASASNAAAGMRILRPPRPATGADSSLSLSLDSPPQRRSNSLRKACTRRSSPTSTCSAGFFSNTPCSLLACSAVSFDGSPPRMSRRASTIVIGGGELVMTWRCAVVTSMERVAIPSAMESVRGRTLFSRRQADLDRGRSCCRKCRAGRLRCFASRSGWCCAECGS